MYSKLDVLKKFFVSDLKKYNLEVQSEENQLIAVRQNGEAIKYIANPSEKVQLEAVKQNVEAILFIGNPAQKVLEYLMNIE